MQPMAKHLSTTAVLSRARALLESGWCQHSLAKDTYGERVATEHPQAKSWCAIGALIKAGHELAEEHRIDDYHLSRTHDKCLQILATCIPMGVNVHSVLNYNDYPGRTRTEILEWFEAAMVTAHQLENLPTEESND